MSTVKRIQYFHLFWGDIFGVISSTLDVKVKLDLYVSEQDRYNEFHLWFDTPDLLEVSTVAQPLLPIYVSNCLNSSLLLCF